MLLERMGFVTLSHEDQKEYANSFERRLQQSKYWIACGYLVALTGYLGIITPLLLDPDTNIFTEIGIGTTLFAFVLCAIAVIELLVDKSFLSRSRFFPSPVDFCSTIVIISVLGGCFQFFGRIVNGHCDEDQNTFTCNPLHEQGHFPSDALLLIGAYLLFSQVVGCVNNSFIVWVCWIPLVFTLLFSASRYEMTDSASSVMTLFFM
jgi:hypothetical protein